MNTHRGFEPEDLDRLQSASSWLHGLADFLKIPQASKENYLLTLPLKKLQAAAKKFCPAPEATEETMEKVA